MMFSLVQLKQVLRRLTKAPVFTAATLVTLALGVGATTAIFSVVEGVILKPPNYPGSDQLIGVLRAQMVDATLSNGLIQQHFPETTELSRRTQSEPSKGSCAMDSTLANLQLPPFQ